MENALTVTGVTIRKIFPDSTNMLKGIASITINEGIAIHNLRILNNAGKNFVAMPNEKKADGMYKDIVHPISEAARSIVNEAVLAAYEAKLSELLGSNLIED